MWHSDELLAPPALNDLAIRRKELYCEAVTDIVVSFNCSVEAGQYHGL